MVIKLDDCNIIHKYPHPGVDFIIILYHSYGHDRGREDELNLAKTNIRYGGAQREMHPKNINQ